MLNLTVRFVPIYCSLHFCLFRYFKKKKRSFLIKSTVPIILTAIQCQRQECQRLPVVLQDNTTYSWPVAILRMQFLPAEPIPPSHYFQCWVLLILSWTQNNSSHSYIKQLYWEPEITTDTNLGFVLEAKWIGFPHLSLRQRSCQTFHLPGQSSVNKTLPDISLVYQYW